MRARFFLSHHLPEHEHRCVRVLGRPVCARCLGMYPLLILGLGLLFWQETRAPGSLEARPLERVLLLVLVAPALIDWIRGRIRPRSGSNVLRLFTGALLGVGLARTIHLQAIAPFEQPSMDVIVFLVVGTVAGEIMARAMSGNETAPPSPDRIAAIDPKGPSDVTSDREPGKETG